jgi:hypothetical protein
VDILVSFLVGAVVIVILMHLHFRNAPDMRVAVVSPPVFAVIGALLGISVGMIWFLDGERTVFIEYGVMRALAGAALGGFVGVGAKAAFAMLGRAKIVAVVLTLMLVGASIGSPLGWCYGAVVDPAEVRGLTQKGMIWGAAIGCLVGLVLGLFEACFGGGRRTVGPAVPAASASAGTSGPTG